MHHEMILTCSFKYKQAASYQPLPPVSHQNVCEGTEKSQGWHCSKERLQLNLLRIFTKYRVGQRAKKKKWWQFLPHPLYRTSHFPRRKRQEESSATFVFYNWGVLKQPCYQIGISEHQEAVFCRGLRTTPHNTIGSTSIQRPHITERRAESLGVGERERGGGGTGNFKGLRSQGQCLGKEQRSLPCSTWWGCVILIYSVSSTHQRARDWEEETLP